MICASLELLQPLLSLTHWIFGSLMLPYKSSSHSANHVRCASTGKRVTRFSGRFAPLRIVFPRPPHPGDRIDCSMLSCRDMAPWLSIHSPTTKWGECGGASHQRGNFISSPVRAAVWFFLLPQGSIDTGAHKGAHHNPRARGASNFSPLRTFGPKGRQPSSPKGACP